jgi:hypothetical protein
VVVVQLKLRTRFVRGRTVVMMQMEIGLLRIPLQQLTCQQKRSMAQQK